MKEQINEFQTAEQNIIALFCIVIFLNILGSGKILLQNGQHCLTMHTAGAHSKSIYLNTIRPNLWLSSFGH